MKKVYKSTLVVLASLFLLGSCTPQANNKAGAIKSPIEYVNPYMGNISHLLVPTYPTVHLPNSMMRVYPERADFTGDRLGGLPLIVTSHRGSSHIFLRASRRRYLSWNNSCRLPAHSAKSHRASPAKSSG